jgi:hypothetical protein
LRALSWVGVTWELIEPPARLLDVQATTVPVPALAIEE